MKPINIEKHNQTKKHKNAEYVKFIRFDKDIKSNGKSRQCDICGGGISHQNKARHDRTNKHKSMVVED